MKLFQICIFFIITKISLNYLYNITLMTSNLTENKYGLNPGYGYIYHLSDNYKEDEKNYFEFEIGLNKDVYKNKLFSLEFVKDSSIQYYYDSLKNTSISYSELYVQENGEKVIIKWSKLFPYTNNYLGVAIIPKSTIDQISIKILSDCRPNDLVTIIVFAVFFGICIFLCILTLIKTKACGSKDSTPLIINQGKSTGLVQNELINNSQV